MKCKKCNRQATHMLIPYEPPYIVYEYACGNHLTNFHTGVHFVSSVEAEKEDYIKVSDDLLFCFECKRPSVTMNKNKHGDGYIPVCEKHNLHKTRFADQHIEQLEYNRFLELMPIVCVDVAIIYRGKVLLIERATPPAFLEWWLPGGRLFKNESLEDCAKRKALQEVGLDCIVGPLLHTQSTIFPEVHSVNFCYLLFSSTDNVVTDDTIEQHKWIALDKVRPGLHSYVKTCFNKITNIQR